jgi:hypothetical protein
MDSEETIEKCEDEGGLMSVYLDSIAGRAIHFRFFELPAELRDSIHDSYLAAFEKERPDCRRPLKRFVSNRTTNGGWTDPSQKELKQPTEEKEALTLHVMSC